MAASEDVPEVVLLLDEVTLRLDAEGRVDTHWHQRFRIDAESAIDEWASLEAGWGPWYEARPELQAEVLLPDGKKLTLDPKTIDVAAITERDATMFRDRRLVRAPLPGVRVGAIVDERIVRREERPFFAGGTFRRFGLGAGVPVERSRLVVDAPEGLPLRFRVHGATLEPKEERREGRRILTFEGGPYAPLTQPEPSSPATPEDWPHIDVSTSPSWADVARRYGAVVDAQLAGARVDELVKDLAGKQQPRRRTITTIMERLADRVRYTGVELGEAALVPRTPGETLARGYGDCKDQSSLLVAALRAVGIPAHVALLRAGYDEEPSDDLPGMDELNHAIVYLPGPPPNWIDPTMSGARPGELAASVRGRRALVAASGTTGLVRIPAATSADTFEHETRELFLAPSGPARVVETSHGRGSVEQGLRSLGRNTQQQVKESLERYVKDSYLAERIESVGWSGLDGLEEQTRLRIVAEGARRGFTDENEAVAAIDRTGLFRRVPPPLERSTPPGPERHSPFVWREPHRSEVEYRIVPPAGHQLRALPPPRKLELGPASLVERYEVARDGTVTAHLSFDSGKAVYTAREAEAFSVALARVRAEKLTLLHFDEPGAKALAEGKVREALRIFRRYAEQEPKLAARRVRLSRIYLELGFGDAARAEARRAVELEPGSLDVQFNLGYVLDHDIYGRAATPGADLAGSLAAYGKARELHPRSLAVLRNLAIGLERDPDGTRWGPHARLEEALPLYRTLRELGEHGLDTNLRLALLGTGRFDELKRVAREAPPSPERNAMVLAAVALTEGVPAFRRELDALGLDAPARAAAAQLAGAYVIRTRAYPLALEVVTFAATLSKSSLQFETTIALLRRTRKQEEVLAGQKGPTLPVLQLFTGIMKGVPAEQLEVLMAKSVRGVGSSVPGSTRADEQQLERLRDQLSAAAQQLGVTRMFLVDATMSALEPHLEGDDKRGYRAVLRTDAAGPGRSFTCYLVREEGRFAIVGNETMSWATGLEILARLERGDRAGAKQWLDWLRRDLDESYRSDDPLDRLPFLTLWPGDGPAPDMQSAAASALATNKVTAGRAVPLLVAALEDASGDRKAALQQSLARAHMLLDRPAEAIPLAQELLALHPRSARGSWMLSSALVASGQVAAARKVAEERVRARPDDVSEVQYLASLHAGGLGELKTAVRLLEKVIDSGKASSSTYNELAWFGLFLPPPRDRSIELALRAVNSQTNSSASHVHTLAALYADAGKTREASEALRKLLALRERGLENEDWYVYGRIAEEYDLREIALAAYERVPRPKREDHVSTWKLAERRRAALLSR